MSSIWSLFDNVIASQELDRPTIPTPAPMPSLAPVSASWAMPESSAPAVNIIEKADRDSVKPFPSHYVSGGIRTFRGVKHDTRRTDGVYAYLDNEALAETHKLLAAKRVAAFERGLAMLEAEKETEQFFNDGTFSNAEWTDTVPFSGVRASNHNAVKRVGS